MLVCDFPFDSVTFSSGKSLVEAVVATILSLFGFDVDCGCYSEYLSKRDEAEFKGLFIAFGVKDQIHYGTFNDLAEQLLNSQGDLRDKVAACINREGKSYQIFSKIRLQ